MFKKLTTILLLVISWLFLTNGIVFGATTRSSNFQINTENSSTSSTKVTTTTSSTTNFNTNYKITDFQSQVNLNQDTTLSVTETIKINITTPMHGIYRIIPVVYSGKGRTINARLNVISVSDESGTPYIYETSRYNQSIKIKIGDPNKTISGPRTYIIKYQINRVVLQYTDHDEIFWNVTGSEWDNPIPIANVQLNSPFAKIIKIDCSASNNEQNTCTSNFKDQETNFSSTIPVGAGNDLTIVVGLNKNNQLQFPGTLEQIINFLTDNWAYPLAIFPIILIGYLWYKNGRDQRFLSDTVYYQPENQKTKTVSLFERSYLPTVYSPIKGLTPAQVGTIIDERVDIQDVVAEIVELARLGFMEIKKIEEKGFLHTTTDYLFIRKTKDASNLKEYQKYLLDNIFLKDKLITDFAEIFKNMKVSQELKDNLNKFNKDTDGNSTQVIKLSALKQEFYTYLNKFKEKLYQNMEDEGYFAGNPEKVRIKWIVISILLTGLIIFINFSFLSYTFNPFPFILAIILGIPAIVLSYFMPRRTAWGYSLYRQTVGLKWYINEGKWREEIAEKNLFLEEILPLAIALGVVNKLTEDMQGLNMQPPTYLNSFTTAAFVSDFNHFNSTVSSTFVSSPSGRSSWSGGSGFGGGGGFSGGGFGGGGGGGW